jgi:hypothetical protein
MNLPDEREVVRGGQKQAVEQLCVFLIGTILQRKVNIRFPQAYESIL